MLKSFKSLTLSKKKFSGKGQSLGSGSGSDSGRVLAVTFHQKTLGITIEKSAGGGALVSAVLDTSEACAFGVARGDVLCEEGGKEVRRSHLIAA